MASKTDIRARILLDNKDLKSGVSEANGLLSGFAGGAKTLMAGGGVAAAATFAKGFLDGMSEQQLASKFGDEIVNASAEIYRGAWGDSIQDVATQMRDVQAGLGDVGNVEKMTEAAFILGEKFDRDVGGTVQDVTELVESFGLEGEAAFDLWAAALEGSTSEVQDELSAATREYGSFFAELGLSAEDTLGLMKKFGEGGAFELDKMGDSVKEFTIRGSDMSTSSVAAYEALGLSAEGMSAMVLAGGEEASAALKITADSLLAMTDPTEQAAAAIALFGTPLEDLGVTQIPSFLESLSGMGDGLEVTEGAVASMGAEMSDNLGTKLETLKREGLGALADFMEERVIPVVESVIAVVVEHWPQIREVIQDSIERVRAVVDEHWPQIELMITTVMETVRALIDRVTAIVSGIWERWGEDITETAEKVWEIVQDVIETTFDLIIDIFGVFKALFEGDWDEMWNKMKDVMSGVLDLIVSVVAGVWETIKLAARIAWDLIKNEVVDAVKAIPGLILNLGQLLYDAGKGLFLQAKNGIAQAAREAATAIIEWVTGLPGVIAGLAVDLYQTGLDMFGRLKDGLIDALAGIPGAIADMVLGPLDEIYGKIQDVVGLGLGSGRQDLIDAAATAQGGGDGTSSSISDNQGLLDAVVKAQGGGGAVLHDGGPVTADLARMYPGPSQGEVRAVLEVGETVIPKGGSGGFHIDTVNVADGRSLVDEMALLETIYGVAV